MPDPSTAPPTDPDFRMHAERTPNPDSIKWVLGSPLLPETQSADFSGPVGPEASPLAARLFAVAGVLSVVTTVVFREFGLVVVAACFFIASALFFFNASFSQKSG